MTKNLKSILILLAIVVVFFAWDFYQNKKKTYQLKAKLEQKGCNLILIGYQLGLTKNEFDQKYHNIYDSTIYNKTLGYIDEGKILKSFAGLKVNQTQFSFSNDVFDGVFNRTDFLTGIVINMSNVTANDTSSIKTNIGNVKQWTIRDRVDDNGKISYSHQWAKINDCVEVSFTFNPSRQKASVTFNIEEYIINSY